MLYSDIPLAAYTVENGKSTKEAERRAVVLWDVIIETSCCSVGRHH